MPGGFKNHSSLNGDLCYTASQTNDIIFDKKQQVLQ